MLKLKINEIFYSLQGESKTVGLPTVFIRLTGCPLRCVYCDTEYAFHQGEQMPLDEIIEQVKKFNTRYVTVTGGEPLAQKNCNTLLTQLCEQGYQVSLETSGAMDVQHVDPRVMKVMDLKTPSSNEESKNKYSNLKFITANDQIKFVISDKADYDWAITQLEKYKLIESCEVLFSPVNLNNNSIIIRELAEWILADQLQVRFQIQLHKFIWGDIPGV